MMNLTNKITKQEEGKENMEINMRAMKSCEM